MVGLMEKELAIARMALRQMVNVAASGPMGPRRRSGCDRPGGAGPGDPDRRGHARGGSRLLRDLGHEHLFCMSRALGTTRCAEARNCSLRTPGLGLDRTGVDRPRKKGARDMKTTRAQVNAGIWLLAVVILAAAPCAHADIVTDANARAAEVVARVPAPPITVRAMAIVQVWSSRRSTPSPGATPRIARSSTGRPAPRWRRPWRRRRGRRSRSSCPRSRRPSTPTTRRWSARSPTVPRRRRASPSASRRRSPSWPWPRRMGRLPPTSIARRRRPASTCRRWCRRCLTGASGAPG